jgi:hypothetical protein
MSKWSVGDIKKNSRFQLIKTLEHKDVVSFVFENIKPLNIATIVFYVFNGVTFLFWIQMMIAGFISNQYEWYNVLGYMAVGLVFGFTIIIPLHELFHGLVYKVLGARNIKFGADLKRMFFYATADKYVTGPLKFVIVALSPFLIISALCIYGILKASLLPQITLLTIMLSHATNCIGDFALLSFYAQNRDKKIYTFDDTGNHTTYFYEDTGK